MHSRNNKQTNLTRWKASLKIELEKKRHHTIYVVPEQNVEKNGNIFKLFLISKDLEKTTDSLLCELANTTFTAATSSNNHTYIPLKIVHVHSGIQN